MLQNGYYLSIYSFIDADECVFNFRTRHDHNMTLWEKRGNKVTLLRHWEFERFTGIKHHWKAFYNQEDLKSFIQEMIAPFGIGLEDIVAVFGTPGISTLDDFSSIEDYPDLSYHAVSHLFSSMLMDCTSFYKDTFVALSIDASSDTALDPASIHKHKFLGAVSKRGKIEFFPVLSPASLWIHASNMFDLEEGTLMALATASQSESFESFDMAREGILNINTPVETVRKLVDGIKDQIFAYSEQDIGTKFNGYDDQFTILENNMSMVMKIIQQLSFEEMDITIQKVIDEYQVDTREACISISGGYALNCPTNTYLMHKYQFKKQYIIPCANDGGQAVGMGLYFFYKKMEGFDYTFDQDYLRGNGVEYELNDEIEQFKDYIEKTEESLSSFVSDITEAPVIWFDARGEIGPRALGYRSILTDPRNNISKELLNRYKGRQWWRPVAPIIMEEYLNEYFEDAFPSPYMLNNFRMKQEKRDLVPAILHLDGTCRIQSVAPNQQRLYSIVSRFYQETGVPMIGNTSLNDKGEPIIETISQAFNFALRKGIRILYINGNRVKLKNHSQYLIKNPEEREYQKYFDLPQSVLEQHNPNKLSELEYYMMKSFPKLFQMQQTVNEELKPNRNAEGSEISHKMVEKIEALRQVVYSENPYLKKEEEN